MSSIHDTDITDEDTRILDVVCWVKLPLIQHLLTSYRYWFQEKAKLCGTGYEAINL